MHQVAPLLTAQLWTQLGRTVRGLTGLVDRLERSGFVKRNAGTADRRASHVFITDKGGGEIERARAVINRVNEQIKADFTESEVESFKKILKSFFVRFGAHPRGEASDGG